MHLLLFPMAEGGKSRIGRRYKISGWQNWADSVSPPPPSRNSLLPLSLARVFFASKVTAACTKSRISLAPSFFISCRGCKTPPLSENLFKQGIPRRRGKVLIFFPLRLYEYVFVPPPCGSCALGGKYAPTVGEEGDAGKERLDVDDLSSVWKEFLPPSLLAPEPSN